MPRPTGPRHHPATARRRLAAVAAASLLAAGCGTAGPPADDPVRDRWASRTDLPGCGTVTLRQGEGLQKRGAREIACLRRALDAGRGAELRVTAPTVEGDLLDEYYRLLPGGRLEVYTDSTEDRYSDGTWSYARCHTPPWLPAAPCPR